MSCCEAVHEEKMQSLTVVFTIGSSFRASRVCLSGVPSSWKCDSILSLARSCRPLTLAGDPMIVLLLFLQKQNLELPRGCPIYGYHETDTDSE